MIYREAAKQIGEVQVGPAKRRELTERLAQERSSLNEAWQKLTAEKARLSGQYAELEAEDERLAAERAEIEQRLEELRQTQARCEKDRTEIREQLQALERQTEELNQRTEWLNRVTTLLEEGNLEHAEHLFAEPSGRDTVGRSGADSPSAKAGQQAKDQVAGITIMTILLLLTGAVAFGDAPEFGAFLILGGIMASIVALAIAKTSAR